MLIREELEKKELNTLSPYASCAINSKGRLKEEEPCDIRTCYMRDRDRIVHSKAFRRLKDKTQVFLSPQGDHYRTRMMHTMEVSQIARTVGSCLNLNQDLIEAIALGHDLGHTPFGHAGERALAAVSDEGFVHSEQSLRIVDILEKEGQGLNLTMEVRDGILNHGTDSHPSTLEGQVVRLSDKMAYIHHDMDDGERAGIITEDQIPLRLRKLLGENNKQRLNTFVHDLVKNSIGKDHIEMSPDMEEALFEMRSFMFSHLYTSPQAKSEEIKADRMLKQLFIYYTEHPEAMTDGFAAMARKEPIQRVVCDYISGMSDQYCIACYKKIFVPMSWSKY
ncbi:MAG: deoxyguanosinetriphosphate triphosphohydrolase [Lachnospiraceae bacterium]|nr:deoxyguanosinetriphosphate triphosphohydrolase [Candidatus Equihabitans merdae]